MFVTLTLNPAVDCTVTVRGPLRLNSIQNVRDEVRTPGGKGLNVAKMIAANGLPVTAGGLVGAGDVPWFRSELRAMGIRSNFLRMPRSTRVNVMATDGQGHEIKLNWPGFPGCKPEWRVLEAYCRKLARQARVVILSGSLPAAYPAGTHARLVRLLRGLGRPVVLDASGAALTLALRERPDVIKPNREELAECLGRKLRTGRAVVDAIRVLMRRQAAVIVSDGGHGAWFGMHGRVLHATSPGVRVVDTTGAGDSLLGQFCCDFFGGLPDRDVAARATAAGAAAVEQPGTPLLSAARVRQLAARVRVSVLA